MREVEGGEFKPWGSLISKWIIKVRNVEGITKSKYGIIYLRDHKP